MANIHQLVDEKSIVSLFLYRTKSINKHALDQRIKQAQSASMQERNPESSNTKGFHAKEPAIQA